jgi:hypothetical protein
MRSTYNAMDDSVESGAVAAAIEDTDAHKFQISNFK